MNAKLEAIVSQKLAHSIHLFGLNGQFSIVFLNQFIVCVEAFWLGVKDQRGAAKGLTHLSELD